MPSEAHHILRPRCGVEPIIAWRNIFGVTTLVLAASLLVGGAIAGGCTVGWLLTGGSVLNGGVLTAIVGFGLGNLPLLLPFISGFLISKTVTSSV